MDEGVDVRIKMYADIGAELRTLASVSVYDSVDNDDDNKDNIGHAGDAYFGTQVFILF